MFTLREIISAVKGKPFRVGPDFFKPTIRAKRIITDSRRAKKGDCFVALKGSRLNGAMFVDKAFSQGASSFILDRKMLSLYPDSDTVSRKLSKLPNAVIVDDSYRALLDLARAYRERFPVRTVAITGSCGKTTVKEITSFLLRGSFPTLASEGNLNNYIGVPLTIFRLRKTHKFLVSEIAASRKGEIAALTSAVKPELGVILNVHPAHLEGFGDVATVYRAKLELAEYLNHHDGVLAICGDDEIFRSLSHSFKGRLVLFGSHKNCHIRLTQLTSLRGKICLEVNNEYRFLLNTSAPFNAMNVLAALAAVHGLGIPIDSFGERLKRFKFPKGRFEVIPLSSGIRVFFDGYNANPTAFNEAISAFRHSAREGRKVVVCGDMLELGTYAENFHRLLGEQLADACVDGVVAVGRWSSTVLDALRRRRRDYFFARSFKEKDAASEFLKAVVKPNDQILIKGSRLLELETMISDLGKKQE